MDPIQRHASERGDRPALIQGERVVTWDEFDARSNQVARALAKLGVGPDDRVGVALRNSIEFYELIGGAGRLGATVMPISFRFKRDEVDYVVDDAKAKVVVAEPANAAEFAGVPGTIFRGEAYDSWVGVEDSSPLAHQGGVGLAPLRYYTSGTTGRPKAIVRLEEDPARAELAVQVSQQVMTDRLGLVSQPGEVHLLAAV